MIECNFTHNSIKSCSECHLYIIQDVLQLSVAGGSVSTWTPRHSSQPLLPAPNPRGSQATCDGREQKTCGGWGVGGLNQVPSHINWLHSGLVGWGPCHGHEASFNLRNSGITRMHLSACAEQAHVRCVTLRWCVFFTAESDCASAINHGFRSTAKCHLLLSAPLVVGRDYSQNKVQTGWLIEGSAKVRAAVYFHTRRTLIHFTPVDFYVVILSLYGFVTLWKCPPPRYGSEKLSELWCCFHVNLK